MQCASANQCRKIPNSLGRRVRSDSSKTYRIVPKCVPKSEKVCISSKGYYVVRKMNDSSKGLL